MLYFRYLDDIINYIICVRIDLQVEMNVYNRTLGSI